MFSELYFLLERLIQLSVPGNLWRFCLSDKVRTLFRSLSLLLLNTHFSTLATESLPRTRFLVQASELSHVVLLIVEENLRNFQRLRLWSSSYSPG